MSFLIHHLSEAPPPGDPHVSGLDRGFQLGDGVFDTLTAFAGRPALVERHVARLVGAAETIGIGLTAAAVPAALAPVLAQLGARDAIIRTTVTRGQAARGLWPHGPSRPSVLVTAQPWSESLAFQPARLTVASVPRNQRSPLSRIKSLAYLDAILAAREAAEAGTDDALILNLDGRVACSTIANVFALDGDTLSTPPTQEGCLDGIVRGLALAEAGSLGFAVRERPLTLSDLKAADGVALTNSVRVLRPVTAIDGAAIAQSPRLAALGTHLMQRLRTL